MTNAEGRIIHLEQELRKIALALSALQDAVAALQQAVRTQQQSPYNAGGGGGIYEISGGSAISGGGNVTGVTVSQRIGASVVTVNANATVYNDMQASTISGKTIICGQNPDGSFTVITQSC